MKKAVLFIFFFNQYLVEAQTKEYFDWNWKPCELQLARFVAVNTQTDSGWQHIDYFMSTKKSQMKGFYSDSMRRIKTGRFTYYYVNGKVSRTGRYVNNKKDGLWLSFYNNGMKQDSIVYDMGHYTGTGLAWFSNGRLSDSSTYNEDGTGTHASWFDNGNVASSGNMVDAKRQGKWQFFHKNGKLASAEEYDADKLVSRIYYDEAGVQRADTTRNDRDAAFKGGSERWKDFLGENLQWPQKFRLVNTDIVTVVARVVIDEDGNIEDAYIDVPFNDAFDAEAIRVIKKSPKWIPAMNHNRRIKYYVRQPITFQQTDF